ncbi:MAG: type 1 glutamine amidotransferase domain-containing protein [Bacilli bacterium]
MKKIAILVADFYDDNELYYPYYRLQEAGFAVHLVGALKGQAYKSKHGMIATSDVAAGEVKASDYDGLVIPGGFSPDYMRRSSEIVQFAKGFATANKPMAAICHGPWLLASVADLKGKKLTSFFSIKDDLVHAGAIYVDAPVVVDGNLVTSRTPKDLPVFLPAFIALVNKA